MRQWSKKPGLFEEGPSDAAAAPGRVGSDDALSLLVQRCAAGDRTAIDELRAWEGGRLRTMVLRMLGDPALADAVLEAALADVYRNAGMLVAVGHGPSDDRVFALVRRHAYAALRTREHQPAAPPPPPPLLQVRPPPAAAPPPAPPRDEPAVPQEAADAPVLRPSPLTLQAPEDHAPEEPGPPPPVALGVATRPDPPRVRRPVGLREEAEDDEVDAFDEEEPARRRWIWAALAWTMAALLGFGVAVLVAGRLVVEAPPELPSAAPPAPAEVELPPGPPTPGRDPAPAGAAPPRSGSPPVGVPRPSSPRDLLGEPLEAPEPAALTVPPPRSPPPPPPPSTNKAPAAAAAPPAAARPPGPPTRPAGAPAQQPAVAPAPAPPPAQPLQEARVLPPRSLGPGPAVPGSARLFIHHSVADPAAAARARALAQRLQQRGASVVIVRPVPFGIRGLSVRYFHGTDRPGAAAVLADAAAFAGDGQAAADRPTDFTGFEPAPRPGTIEIWLPGGA